MNANFLYKREPNRKITDDVVRKKETNGSQIDVGTPYNTSSMRCVTNEQKTLGS